MRLFGIFIMAIMMISLTSANVFVFISPDPLNAEQQINKQENYQIDITNQHNFTIYDFKFGNLTNKGFSFPDISIPSNTTETFNITANPKSSISESITNNIEFHYNASIPEEVTTYTVNISDLDEGGFNKNFMVIRKGDTIKLQNNGDIFHTVDSDNFNQEILPNQSYSHTFNEKGTFEIRDPNWDEYSSFVMEVDVISRDSEEKVHNSEYDFSWTTNLEFNLKPTDLQISFPEKKFNVSAKGETEGLIKLETGNETAQNVQIDSNSGWIVPKENEFEIGPQSQKFVAYTILPTISSSNETDKTYPIQISAEGKNTQKVSGEISVFIPFSDNFGDPTTVEGLAGLISRFRELCKENPNFPLCNPNQTITETPVNNTNQTFTFNSSATEWGEVKTDMASVETSVKRISNDFNSYVESDKSTDQKALELANKSYQKSLEVEEAKDSRNIVLIIFFSFLAITSSCVLLIKTMAKRKRIKNRIEGPYDYNPLAGLLKK